ncbi:hypothetical protein HNQ77_000255 [Silvibacterium bohemicum]|uniref:Uncharacterized protein n=1 Tax=Silvibacterium bohemicum TaxID=1577686 RepID=A0A841JNZ8_9BACT|nr:hypothetical protein [Silvibacterium bohemicum]MBB6142317.1 hypothetical protein [Silvibacterium bohemicum]
MKINRLSIPALALILGTSGSVLAFGYSAPQGPPPPGYGQEQGGWDAPPAEFQDIQRRGFHDGIEGARKDFDNHRPPSVENRDEFRHPPVPRDARRDYRDGFRRGYETAMHHMMGPR